MLNKLNKRRGGFTLVEIMIVVAIIALLAAIAVPGFLRARKRSQASKVLNDLRLIDSAVDQYAIENNKKANDVVGTAAWTQYMKGGTTLYNTGAHPVYGGYGAQTVDVLPVVPTAAFNDLSDVAPSSFWAPYYR
ncbi:MAG TPA: prepilin-type N-terminal cleavage/methylation domain-containing protein [Chthoniobacterales bacterium]|nr:prepilin-type N-terminal cleavage/methylation domain-containing protein [Chthoniobacterales bacterium]